MMDNDIGKRKRKIIFGINDFLVGGAQRQLTRQFQYFNRDKYEFHVATLFSFSGKHDLYQMIPSWVAVKKFNFRGFWDVPEWFRLAAYLWRLKPDLVVSSLFFSNTVFRILKIFIGYPIVAREHNTYTDKKFGKIAVDWILSFVSRRIVAVSRTVADFTARQEHIPRRKFQVIRNGIDLAEIEKKADPYRGKMAELKTELGFAPEQKIFLNVARLTPQKNQAALIRAFAEWSLEHGNYVLLVLGEGSLRAELESLVADLRMAGRVRFLGVKEQIEKYYLAADYLLSASLIEGLSNAYLEALAYGLPLVATKTAGTDELLEDGVNGFVITTPLQGDILAALDRAAEAADNLEILRKNAILSVIPFDIRETVRSYEELFDRCAA